MSEAKQSIHALIGEMLPNIAVHVLFPHERLASVGTVLQDAYGKEAVTLMELQIARLNVNQHALAHMMRIPLAELLPIV